MRSRRVHVLQKEPSSPTSSRPGQGLARRGVSTSVERSIWSASNLIWRAYRVPKPRLSRELDRGADWVGTAGIPNQLSLFLGAKDLKNQAAMGYLNRCLEEKTVTENLLLHGPAGCGKSALVKVFLSEFLESFTSNLVTYARLQHARVLKILPELQMVEEVDGVRIFLRILQNESVGYEILAVKALFRKFWPDLSRCIAVSQQVFCDKHYLSEMNVLKVIDPKELRDRETMARCMKPWDSLGPLEKCPACTLHPPCRHISKKDLTVRGMQRRSELPRRLLQHARSAERSKKDLGSDGKVEQVDCIRFVRRGVCRTFNELGRCNFHHPLDVHVMKIPPARCPKCTIRLPCGRCDNGTINDGEKNTPKLSAPVNPTRVKDLHGVLHDKAEVCVAQAGEELRKAGLQCGDIDVAVDRM
ncbi:unnamed protein product [Ascophyllum nodosum]